MGGQPSGGRPSVRPSVPGVVVVAGGRGTGSPPQRAPARTVLANPETISSRPVSAPCPRTGPRREWEMNQQDAPLGGIGGVGVGAPLGPALRYPPCSRGAHPGGRRAPGVLFIFIIIFFLLVGGAGGPVDADKGAGGRPGSRRGWCGGAVRGGGGGAGRTRQCRPGPAGPGCSALPPLPLSVARSFLSLPRPPRSEGRGIHLKPLGRGRWRPLLSGLRRPRVPAAAGRSRRAPPGRPGCRYLPFSLLCSGTLLWSSPGGGSRRRERLEPVSGGTSHPKDAP